MRLRTTVAATLGALALIVTLPTSADAGSGDFLYRFTGLDGTPQYTGLTDPASRECITLPEVADPGSSNPANSPRNYTDSTATVFTGPDCEGVFFTLRPFGGHASERLKLRSVVFS
ncbi:hypothetical protein AB0N06_18155 [Streptomyces sp. NPDC051020]|uniref:hypothetical protein n=1 Tax=Streptomyces sp. NPDC051020 TaxID=3155409 RepID=UPI003412235F